MRTTSSTGANTSSTRGKKAPTKKDGKTPIKKKTAKTDKSKEKPKPTLRATTTRKLMKGLTSDEGSKVNAHDKYNKRRTVDKLHVDIKGNSARVMHLTELPFGHKDADLDFAERVLSHLESLPSKERPDVIVTSGLLYGGFHHREKNNRRSKTMSVNEQLKHAKEFMDRLRKVGVTVVYNISDNDQKIIEDYTYDAVRTLEGIARENGEDWPTSFANFDRIQQSHLWQRNFEFQWDVVFEYMLRSGRRLYTAGEVNDIAGEEIEEFILLLDAHRRLERGQELTPIMNQVLEVGNIPHKKRPEDNLIVTSDYNMELETKGQKTQVAGRHEFRQSATSMVQRPTHAAEEILSQMEAAGQKVPDWMVIENQQHPVGMIHPGGERGTIITSTPGMTGFNFDTSSYGRVQSDKAERIAKSRREVNLPGVQQVEFHDDGRISVHLMNDALMDIAAKTSERHAAIFFSDWQTGSVTARPDLAVKAMDYALHSVLMRQPGMLFLNGDIIQGRNYPEMPNENTNMGLIKISDQQLFVYEMLQKILDKMPRKAKNNLQGVHITPGNHEWNSGHKHTGTAHSLFIKAAFDSQSEKQFKTHLHSYDNMIAGASHMKSYTAIAELAAHKVLAQHIMMERGGKGSGGLPIGQFASMLKSTTGPLMKEINIMGAGHFHHPSYMMAANKIGHINGSLAGLSGYEWWRGYNPVMGTSIVHIGGNKPPEIEFLTPQFLYGYGCKGAYSDNNLEKEGFETDKKFDPKSHGFGKIKVDDGEKIERMPQSAIQKQLWDQVDDILWRSNTKLA